MPKSQQTNRNTAEANMTFVCVHGTVKGGFRNWILET